MISKERIEKIVAIAERAEAMGLLMFDRMSLIMDLQYTDVEFKLRLDELLKADAFDFAHDITGIQQNFNRETKRLENLFLPRYAEQ